MMFYNYYVTIFFVMSKILMSFIFKLILLLEPLRNILSYVIFFICSNFLNRYIMYHHNYLCTLPNIQFNTLKF